MDVSARQLRTGLRNPAVLARQLQLARENPIPPDTPRSAQRRWIDAAVKRYYASGRDPAVLLADYDERTSRSERRLTAATEIANGRQMLMNFLAHDRGQPEPTRVQVSPVRVDLFRLGITMGVDIAVETPSGWLLRQLVTDGELTQLEHLRLYATAAAMHFERRGDGGPIARVELLLLRRADRMVTWPRALLRTSEPRLETRCGQIRSGTTD